MLEIFDIVTFVRIAWCSCRVLWRPSWILHWTWLILWRGSTITVLLVLSKYIKDWNCYQISSTQWPEHITSVRLKFGTFFIGTRVFNCYSYDASLINWLSLISGVFPKLNLNQMINSSVSTESLFILNCKSNFTTCNIG